MFFCILISAGDTLYIWLGALSTTNFHGAKEIREDSENYYPQKFSAIRYLKVEICQSKFPTIMIYCTYLYVIDNCIIIVPFLHCINGTVAINVMSFLLQAAVEHSLGRLEYLVMLLLGTWALVHRPRWVPLLVEVEDLCLDRLQHLVLHHKCQLKLCLEESKCLCRMQLTNNQ